VDASVRREAAEDVRTSRSAKLWTGSSDGAMVVVGEQTCICGRVPRIDDAASVPSHENNKA